MCMEALLSVHAEVVCTFLDLSHLLPVKVISGFVTQVDHIPLYLQTISIQEIMYIAN